MSDMMNQDDQMLPVDEEQERLGNRLRESREYLGLSQEFVAEHLGIPRASISAMENGKRKVSSLELKQLARIYKQPLSYFLGEDEFARDEQSPDVIFSALYRTTRALSDQDRQQVLRFAQFLRQAGQAPAPKEKMDDSQ
jgi:transcriptional regulator with XRE-family HTH domain